MNHMLLAERKIGSKVRVTDCPLTRSAKAHILIADASSTLAQKGENAGRNCRFIRIAKE